MSHHKDQQEDTRSNKTSSKTLPEEPETGDGELEIEEKLKSEEELKAM